MRLRDLRWYILSCVILILSYAAIAVCYYLPVRAKAESSMKVLGSEATINIEKMAEARVYSLYDSFLVDDSIGEEVNITAVESKFNNVTSERKILLQQDHRFTNNLSTDYKYYFYFLKEVKTIEDEQEIVSYSCRKVLLDDVISFVINDSENVFDTFVYASDGTLFSHNVTIESNDYNIFSAIKASDLLDDTDSFCGVYNINGINGVLSGTSFFGYYISTFIPITSPYLAIDWVVQQALIFYAMGIFILIAMLVILILGCRKASKLLRVDRHSVEASKAVVIRCDLSGKVIFTNKTFKQIYGIKKLESIDSLIDVDTQESVLATMKQNKAFECSLTFDDDKVHYFHLSPLKVARSYYLMGTDITLDYLRRKHLFLMSGRNEITNCDNSFSLTNNFNHIVENSSYLDIAFVEYNIMKYEEIIGVFGRANFNILLNEFLTVIHEAYSSLAIYQMDDSKFIVVFPNSDIDEVTSKITESLETLKKPFQIKKNQIYVKCKVVIYDLKKEDKGSVDLETIKNKLDLSLRNIADFSTKDYILYEPAMDGAIEAADEMERDLVKGLEDEEFRMYLQPQYDVNANRIDGFEALIRWMNPKYKDKSPQAFIELAEQRGYMLDIGRYVIKETFRLAKKLEPYNVHVSMNVSPIQLLQVGFVQQIIDEFKVMRLKPGSVAIEITETFLMGNFQLMQEKLRLLHEQGFHIHLDDFCTGYSSMLYLKDLPVDTLKIDKEFTKYIVTNKVHYNIVKTIVELGNSLNMDLIVEGVETEEQSNIVKKFGARLIQGYLIGKAVPYEQAVALLEKYNSKK